MSGLHGSPDIQGFLPSGPSTSPRVRDLAEQLMDQLRNNSAFDDKARFAATMNEINRGLLGYSSKEDSTKREDEDEEEEEEGEEESVGSDDISHDLGAFRISEDLKDASFQSLARLRELRMGFRKGQSSAKHSTSPSSRPQKASSDYYSSRPHVYGTADSFGPPKHADESIDVSCFQSRGATKPGHIASNPAETIPQNNHDSGAAPQNTGNEKFSDNIDKFTAHVESKVSSNRGNSSSGHSSDQDSERDISVRKESEHQQNKNQVHVHHPDVHMHSDQVLNYKSINNNNNNNNNFNNNNNNNNNSNYSDSGIKATFSNPQAKGLLGNVRVNQGEFTKHGQKQVNLSGMSLEVSTYTII